MSDRQSWNLKNCSDVCVPEEAFLRRPRLRTHTHAGFHQRNLILTSYLCDLSGENSMKMKRIHFYLLITSGLIHLIPFVVEFYESMNECLFCLQECAPSR